VTAFAAAAGPRDPRPEGTRFPFRPWVRRSVRRAMVGGGIAIVTLAAVAWLLRDPRQEIYGRAFAVLGVYVALFVAALGKIWWTAGGDAPWLEPAARCFQPLHLLRPRRVELARVVACGPRPGTHSLRLVVETARGERELFLNLALLDGRTRFLALLGAALRAQGLEPVPGRSDAWRRPGWEEPQLSS
jgi:hypothetical protein